VVQGLRLRERKKLIEQRLFAMETPVRIIPEILRAFELVRSNDFDREAGFVRHSKCVVEARSSEVMPSRRSPRPCFSPSVRCAAHARYVESTPPEYATRAEPRSVRTVRSLVSIMHSFNQRPTHVCYRIVTTRNRVEISGL